MFLLFTSSLLFLLLSGDILPDPCHVGKYCRVLFANTRGLKRNLRELSVQGMWVLFTLYSIFYSFISWFTISYFHIHVCSLRGLCWNYLCFLLLASWCCCTPHWWGKRDLISSLHLVRCLPRLLQFVAFNSVTFGPSFKGPLLLMLIIVTGISVALWYVP